MQVIHACMNHLNSEFHKTVFFVKDFPVISNCIELCVYVCIYVGAHVCARSVFICV